MNFKAKFCLKLGGSFSKGLNHDHLALRKALSNQAAQNGAGHVAAANEGQAHFLKINVSRCSHESFSKNRQSHCTRTAKV